MTPELNSPQDAPDQKMQDASRVGQSSDAIAPTMTSPAGEPSTAGNSKTKAAPSRVKTSSKPSAPEADAAATDVSVGATAGLPAAKKPVARKTATAKPAASKPAAAKATGSKATAAKPAAAKSAAAKPAAKSAVAKPAASPSTAPKKPAARKPAATKPAAAAPAEPEATVAEPDGTESALTAAPAQKPARAAASKPKTTSLPAKPRTTASAAKSSGATTKKAGPAAPAAEEPRPFTSVSTPVQKPATSKDETPVADVAAEAESARRPEAAGDPRATAVRKPSARKSPSSPGTGPGRTTKRTPAKRAPVTLSAQVTSGDLAISAPGGAGKIDTGSQPASDTATTVVETQQASEIVVPPLPDLSPIDAALKFETMPEAPERRSLLDDQEPMRFVWSKRWPFLALVPESSVAAKTTPEPHAETIERPTGAPTTEPEVAADAPVREPAPVETAETAPADSLPAVERADDLEGFVEAPHAQRPDRPVQLDVAEQPDRTEDLPAADQGGPTDFTWDTPRPAPAAPTQPAAEPEPEPSPELGTTVIAVTADPEPVTVTDPDVSSPAAAGDLPDGVDTARVNELLDEIEAAEEAEPTAVETTRVDPATSPVVLRISGLSRRFGDTIAVDRIDLDVHEGSFYGIVGPNGAGKTTTLSMVTGLLRPDAGSISVHGVDVWTDPDRAKRSIGVLPDRLRLFDRLTGAQFLYYSGILRGLDGATVRSRVKDLARAFGLEDALNRLVTDYSAGMTKKVALAAAMIHSPRLLVLDEPFESVDPVSAANVIEILQKYVAHGGTVVLSSHGMDLIQRVCDHVAIIVNGHVLASGAVDDVRGSGTLEDRFVELAGGRKAAEGMEWLHSFSD